MSYMSELSIEAATTHREGPISLDLLAHEVSHAAVAYFGPGYNEEKNKAFKDLVYKFESIHKVMAMCEEHRCSTPGKLKDLLSGMIATLYCTSGYNVDYDKLNDLRDKYRLVLETAKYF